jgi:dCMP deaminase
MKIDKLGIKITKEPKYAKWLKECYRYSRRSIHPSTHNASLLIKNNKIILKGANLLPPGVKALKYRFSDANKHIYPNHAESDIIYKAARKGIATKGLTMVEPWLPCIPCANAVISAGIKRLVIHKQMSERTSRDWQAELKEALKLMHEAGVEIVAYDGIIGEKAYMHHQIWNA